MRGIDKISRNKLARLEEEEKEKVLKQLAGKKEPEPIEDKKSKLEDKKSTDKKLALTNKNIDEKDDDESDEEIGKKPPGKGKKGKGKKGKGKKGGQGGPKGKPRNISPPKPIENPDDELKVNDQLKFLLALAEKEKRREKNEDVDMKDVDMKDADMKDVKNEIENEDAMSVEENESDAGHEKVDADDLMEALRSMQWASPKDKDASPTPLQKDAPSPKDVDAKSKAVVVSPIRSAVVPESPGSKPAVGSSKMESIVKVDNTM